MLARIGSVGTLPIASGSLPSQRIGAGAAGGEGVGKVGGSGEGSFGASLEAAVNSVNDHQVQADDKLTSLASGRDTDLHGTMIALEEANIALRAMASARDKVVEAYQTIWNMQV
jgi:flagellar hook-basal body complex protein FliE